MSTLKVTNIQDTSGGNSATTEQIYKGIAKAWVNFDGTLTSTAPYTSASAIRSFFNVSSITYNANGDYTLNFTNPFLSGNYAVCGSGSNDFSGGGSTIHIASGQQSPTASSLRIRNFNESADNASGSISRSLYISVVVFGST